MLEKQRQAIMFGNFKSISLNGISKCSRLFDADATLDTAPDILTAPVQGASMRPVILMNNTHLFIGSERIHFQEIDGKIDNYTDFLNKALGLFKIIMDNFEVSPNRLAYNGIFTDIPDKSIIKVKNIIFKEDILGKGPITDWDFRINHQIAPSENFTVKINQVITSTSHAVVASPDGNTTTEPLIFGYDCNTDKENTNNFSMDDCEKFKTTCQNFRETIIKLL